MEFTNIDGIRLVHQVIQTIKENRDYLSRVDGEAGDGDQIGRASCRERVFDIV